jgi:hypothetical protein
MIINKIIQGVAEKPNGFQNKITLQPDWFFFRTPYITQLLKTYHNRGSKAT